MRILIEELFEFERVDKIAIVGEADALRTQS